MTLNLTLDQVRDSIVADLGKVDVPNPWWTLAYGNDCLGFITFHMGLRTAKQFDARFTSIEHFIDWIRQDPDWEIVPAEQARPGDILFENWERPRTRTREHAEWLYAGTPGAGPLMIASANTGPAAGVDEPRGSWKKQRDVGDWLVDAARPPYRSAAATATPRARADARLAGTWLNQQPELRHAGIAETGVGDRKQADGTIKPGDGITSPAPLYWTAVQTWGHLHGKYPVPPFRIDGIPGKQSRKVEALILARAKAARR